MFNFITDPRGHNSTSGSLFLDGVRFYYSFYCDNTVQSVGIQAELRIDDTTQYSNAITVSTDSVFTSVYYQGAY